MICGRCEYMRPTDGACRLPSSGRQVVAYFQEACKARNTQNDNDMEETKNTKVCKVCGQEKPLEEFARNRWGYTDYCKDCMKAKKEGKAPETPKIENTAAEVIEEMKEHNEQLRITAHLSAVATPVLMDELKRRGWTGTLVQHKEITI